MDGNGNVTLTEADVARLVPTVQVLGLGEVGVAAEHHPPEPLEHPQRGHGERHEERLPQRGTEVERLAAEAAHEQPFGIGDAEHAVHLAVADEHELTALFD